MAIKVSHNGGATTPKSILASPNGTVVKVKQVFASHQGAARKVWPLGADGSTWVSQSAPNGHGWRFVCYGKGLFVALAHYNDSGTASDYFMTSPDGIVWTLRPKGTTKIPSGICFAEALGLFLITTRDTGATENSGYIITSANGTTLNEITGLPRYQMFHPCYGNGRALVLTGSSTSNTYLLSTNPAGVNWTPYSLPQYKQWTNFIACFGNGKFVIVSQTGISVTSTNGIDWTHSITVPNGAWASICYGNGLYVALSNSTTGNRVMTSPDGLNWTLRATPSDGTNTQWMSICYGNGVFVAVAGSGTGARVMTSTDGYSWSLHAAAAANPWQSVCYGNDIFVSVASTGAGNRVMTSS